MSEFGIFQENGLSQTRRQLFGRAALGLGTASLAQLMGPSLQAATTSEGATGAGAAGGGSSAGAGYGLGSELGTGALSSLSPVG